MKKVSLFAVCMLLSLGLWAQDQPSPILFIFDGSGSMWGQMEDATKIEIAREVLGDVVSELPADQSFGLMAYGHRVKSDCADVEFIIEDGSADDVSKALKNINPLGMTPLAHSSKLALEYLEKKGIKATIILITDGIETCDGNLCDLVAAYKAKGIEFVFHIVGFGLKKEETSALKCATEAGNGRYLDASNSGELGSVLQEATQTKVDEPETNFNLVSYQNDEGIDVAAKMINQEDGKWVRSVRTYGDTGKIYLAPGIYRMEARAVGKRGLQELVIPDIVIEAGKQHYHKVDYTSGILSVEVRMMGALHDAVVHIKHAGEKKTIARSRTYTSENSNPKTFDLVAGKYDISVGSVSINGPGEKHLIEGVEIVAGETTEAAHDFESCTLSVGATHNGELWDATVYISSTDPKGPVAQGRTYTTENNNPKTFLLSPGEYQFTVKPLKLDVDRQTITIQLKAGEQVKRMIEF